MGIREKVKSFFSRSIPELETTSEQKLFVSVVENNQCPDCKKFGFLAGPRGGLAQNVKCANRECGSRFNVTPFSADRI